MTAEPSARISFDQYAAYARSYLTHRDRVLLSQPSSALEGLSWLTYAAGWKWLDPIQHTSSGMVFEQTAGLDRSFGVVVRNPPSSGVEDVAGSGSGIHEQEEQSFASNVDGGQESLEVKDWEVVTVHQTICYSSTWKVPVLWFHAHRANGETIPSDDLVRFGVVFPSGTLPLNNDPQEQSQHEVSESSDISIDACDVSHHRSNTPPRIVDVPDTQLSPRIESIATTGGISIADHPRTRLPSYYLHPCNTHAALQVLLPDTLQVAKEEDGAWRYIGAFINLCAGAVEMRAG